MLPLNKNGICGIIDKLFLSECKPIFLISQPPIKICESYYPYVILKRACIILDFPAPVLPTMATFSPSYILKFNFFNVKSNYSLYFILKFLN